MCTVETQDKQEDHPELEKIEKKATLGFRDPDEQYSGETVPVRGTTGPYGSWRKQGYP